MRWFETYPAPLEAVLGTEEAVLDAELQAGRALQGASIVVTIDAEALLLGWWFRSHDCREVPVREQDFDVLRNEGSLESRALHEDKRHSDRGGSES